VTCVPPQGTNGKDSASKMLVRPSILGINEAVDVIYITDASNVSCRETLVVNRRFTRSQKA
jgi:hypothetical protein